MIDPKRDRREGHDSSDTSRQRRWEKIDQIVEFALSAPPDRRQAFVRAACGSDTELRREVESLLEHVGASEELFSNLHAALSGRGDSRQADAGADPLVGQTIKRYQLKERLPSGMAHVYRAWDLAAERQVVVKITPTGLGTEAATEATQRMRREALGDVVLRHRNVCEVLDSGETLDQRAYVVLEFCAGRTLAERLAENPLPWNRASIVVAQVADALVAAHQLGMIHRDVKPANIMVQDSLEVKLLDFGIARLEDTRLTRTGHILGTLEYMSPEQTSGDQVSSASDVWSLGTVLYESVTGQHPFRRRSKRETVAAIVDADLGDGPWGADLPDGLRNLIQTMLSKDVAARPTAASVRQSLHVFLSPHERQ